jgi:hypothetical protein
MDDLVQHLNAHRVQLPVPIPLADRGQHAVDVEKDPSAASLSEFYSPYPSSPCHGVCKATYMLRAGAPRPS